MCYGTLHNQVIENPVTKLVFILSIFSSSICLRRLHRSFYFFNEYILFLLFLNFWNIISTIFSSRFDTFSVSRVSKTHINCAYKYLQSSVSQSFSTHVNRGFFSSSTCSFERGVLDLLDFFVGITSTHWFYVCFLKNSHYRCLSLW